MYSKTRTLIIQHKNMKITTLQALSSDEKGE